MPLLECLGVSHSLQLYPSGMLQSILYKPKKEQLQYNSEKSVDLIGLMTGLLNVSKLSSKAWL